MAVTINDGTPVAGELDIQTELIDITSSTATKPDPAWEHIDPAGHFHAYDRDGKLPTLVARSRHVACNGGCGDEGECEGYDVTDFYCLICDAEVQPKRIPDTEPKSAPGLTTWEVSVHQHLEIGQKVSVRLTYGDTMRFGVAQVVDVAVQFDRPIISKLIGAGPLGQRQRVRADA